MSGKMNAKDGVTHAMANMIGALAPVDIAGFIQNGEFSWAPIFPTISKPIVEIVTNKNYMGFKIANEPFTKEQEELLANSGLGKKNVNPAIKFVTDFAFRYGGGDSRLKYYRDENHPGADKDKKVPGFLDINPSQVEHLFKGYTGGTGAVISDLMTTVAQAFNPEEEVAISLIALLPTLIG
jgi:hypothetical protein